MPHKVFLTQLNHGTFFLETVLIHGQPYHIKSINRNLFGLYNDTLELVTLFRGHHALVRCVAPFFNGDICHIASGSNDATIAIWHSHTGQLLQTIRPDAGEVTALKTYQHHGETYLVSGHLSGEMVFINPFTGEILHRNDAAHQGTVNCLTSFYEEDTGFIVSGGADGKLTLWEANIYERCHDFPRREPRTINCCTSYKNQFDQWIIAAGGSADGVEIWSAMDSMQIAHVDNGIGSHVVFCTTSQHANGKVILVAGNNSGDIGTWYTDAYDFLRLTKTTLYNLTCCTSYVTGNINRLLLANTELLIECRLTADASHLTSARPSQTVCASTFYQHEGQIMMVTADLFGKAIHIYNCQNDTITQRFTPPKQDNTGYARFLKVTDSRFGMLLIAGHDNGPIYIWRITDGKLLHQYSHLSHNCALDTTAVDTIRLITADISGFNACCITGATVGESHYFRIAMLGSPTYLASYQSEGQARLVVGTHRGQLIIVHPDNGHILRQLNGHVESISCLWTYQEAGKNKLLSSSEDHLFCVWDLDTGEQLLQFVGIDANPCCCTSYVLNHERLFFSGHFTGLLCCWDANGILKGRPLTLPSTPLAIFCSRDGIYVSLKGGNLIFISFKNSAAPGKVPKLTELAATAFKQRPDYLAQYPRLDKAPQKLLSTTWLWPW